MKIGTKNHCDVEFMFINETNILVRQIACYERNCIICWYTTVCLFEYVYKLVIHMRERERETVKCQCTNKIVENNFGFLLLFLAYWGTKWYPFSMLFNPANMWNFLTFEFWDTCWILGRLCWKQDSGFRQANCQCYYK